MSPTQGLQASGNSHPRPHRTATVSEYTVKAYYLPRYSSFSLSSNAPNRLIDASVKLKASDWSIDLSQVFPSGTNADSYFVGGPPQNWPTPPCFCGQTLGNVKETEVEEQNDEWDAYWDCTAICKLRRRYQAYMGEQEKLYGEKMGGNPFEYILFVEGGDNGDQDEVPLLDRESEFELDVPMSERAMVMVRVEGWIPVDVKPIIVENQVIRDVGEGELIYLEKFLKGICSNEPGWDTRFHRVDGPEYTFGEVGEGKGLRSFPDY